MSEVSDPQQPLYMQIAAQLEDAIQSGALAQGEKIASERALAETMAVSRMTARQAIQHLVHRGLLETRVGQGTFVGNRTIEQKLTSLTGFTEEMIRQGRRASSIVVLSETRRADAQCAAALRLGAGAMVHRLVRIRMVDDVPVARETTDIRADTTPGLLDLADFARHSLYATLKDHFGLVAATAEQTLGAAIATGEAARSLAIAEGGAVLKLTRLTFDSTGLPLEYVRSLYRGDTFTMKVDLASLDRRIQ